MDGRQPKESLHARSQALNDVAELVAALDLERIERNIFRGRAPPDGRARIFGGLVVAQALVAAARTVEARTPHSLHAYFVLPGDPSVPIVYEVERVRDGRSFTTRRCVAVQDGRAIFDLFASFQADERGLEHQMAPPEVPDPDMLPNQEQLAAKLGDRLPPELRAWFGSKRAIEVRPCSLSRFDPKAPRAPRQDIWIRASTRLPDDPAIHRAVLTYLSDLTLIDAALAAHGRSLFEPDFSVASLDHALWFHRPCRVDEWLLYTQDSPTTSGSRGLARGLIYDRAGRLCASVMQEGLIRVRDKRPG